MVPVRVQAKVTVEAILQRPQCLRNRRRTPPILRRHSPSPETSRYNQKCASLFSALQFAMDKVLPPHKW